MIYRDIVQFLEYNKFKNDTSLLARETLAEIPRQFLDYMRMKGIEPYKDSRSSALATHDFIQNKIEERRQRKEIEGRPPPKFLQKKKEQFFKSLITMGYEESLVYRIVEEEGIPAADVNLVAQRINQIKKSIRFLHNRLLC